MPCQLSVRMQNEEKQWETELQAAKPIELRHVNRNSISALWETCHTQIWGFKEVTFAMWNPQLQVVDPPKRVVCPRACRGHFSICKDKNYYLLNVTYTVYFLSSDSHSDDCFALTGKSCCNLPSDKGHTTCVAVGLVYCLLLLAKPQSWQKLLIWPTILPLPWLYGSST